MMTAPLTQIPRDDGELLRLTEAMVYWKVMDLIDAAILVTTENAEYYRRVGAWVEWKRFVATMPDSPEAQAVVRSPAGDDQSMKLGIFLTTLLNARGHEVKRLLHSPRVRESREIASKLSLLYQRDDQCRVTSTTAKALLMCFQLDNAEAPVEIRAQAIAALKRAAAR